MLKRVEALEKSLLETREKVVRIEAVVESIKQHGATKEDIQKVYVAIEANGTKIESMGARIEAMGTRVEAMGRTMIQWAVGTAIAMAGLAFAAAKLIHV